MISCSGPVEVDSQSSDSTQTLVKILCLRPTYIFYLLRQSPWTYLVRLWINGKLLYSSLFSLLYISFSESWCFWGCCDRWLPSQSTPQLMSCSVSHLTEAAAAAFCIFKCNYVRNVKACSMADCTDYSVCAAVFPVCDLLAGICLSVGICVLSWIY